VAAPSRSLKCACLDRCPRGQAKQVELFFGEVGVPGLKGVSYHNGEVILLEVPLNNVYCPETGNKELLTIVAAVTPLKKTKLIEIIIFLIIAFLLLNYLILVLWNILIH
jgi:hypothetical protein